MNVSVVSSKIKNDGKFYRVVIAEDNPTVRHALGVFLKENYGFEVVEVASVEELKGVEADFYVTDLFLKDGCAFEVEFPKNRWIVITGRGGVDEAVEAVKKGAYDFLLKPVDLKKLKVAFENMINFVEMEKELEKRGHVLVSFSDKVIVGVSENLKRAVSAAKEFAVNNKRYITVFGETGVGKSLLSDYIAYLFKGVIKRLSLAAVDPDFAHMVLCGTSERKGMFCVGGDELLIVEDMHAVDVKVGRLLVNILDEWSCKVADTGREVPIKGKVVFNVTRLEDTKLPQELMSRLETEAVEILPLRERKEDIIPIFDYLLNKHSKEATSTTYAALLDMELKGNVRELENLVKSAKKVVNLQPGIDKLRVSLNLKKGLDENLRVVERMLIEQALSLEKSVAGAAKLLGIKRTTLIYRMKKLGIEIKGL